MSSVLLRLVEEPAALEELSALLGGYFDVSRREQKYLVGNTLHPAVQCIRETAGEVDQSLRQLRIGSLQIEDHRQPLLEAVGDLLRVVEAARQDEVHADVVRVRDDLHLGPGRSRRSDGGDPVAGLLAARLGPVVVLVPATPRRQPADVRPLAVALLEALLGGVSVLVLPVLVLLGDAEVDERAVPEVAEGHPDGDSSPGRARILRGRTSPPPPRRRGSPASCPSTARAGRGRRRGSAAGRTTAATTAGRRPQAASWTDRARRRRGSRRSHRGRHPTSSPRPRG